MDQAVRYFSGLVEEMSLEGVAPVPSLALLRVGAGGLEVFVSPEVNGSLGWFSPTDDGRHCSWTPTSPSRNWKPWRPSIGRLGPRW